MAEHPQPLALVARALERTLAAGPARCGLEWCLAFKRTPEGEGRARGPRRGQAVKALAWDAAKRAAKAAWGAANRRWELHPHRGEGVIDFAARRYLLDHGGYQVVVDGDREFSRTDEGWSPSAGSDAGHTHGALWLVDILRGATAATESGRESVRGVDCRRLDVRIDLARASAATPGGIAVPEARRFEELLDYPSTVWVDDQERIRRVRQVEGTLTDPAGGATKTSTLELYDFGHQQPVPDPRTTPTTRHPAS